MEVVASTDKGYLISATEDEIKAIVTSVTGNKPKIIKRGLKLPAIDYASTIIKLKTLANDYTYKQLCGQVFDFNKTFSDLKEAVNSCITIED